MGKSSGGGNTTTTQKADPWSPSIPMREQGLSAAQGAYNGGQFGQVAPFSQPTEQALDLTQQRALAGSPVTDNAQTMAADTLGGKYLSAGNPYFGAMADRVTQQVMPGLNATFGAAGRTGSDLHQGNLSRGLGDAIGALAYQNYGDERQRQLQAATMAPSLANADYNDLSKLAAVGATRDDRAQALLDQPYGALSQYSNLVNQFGGQGGTTVQSGGGTKSNPLLNTLGGAGAGAAIGGPWGALAGGGLGLLGSLF